MAEPQNKDASDDTVFDNLTGTQKSAILMMLIGEMKPPKSCATCRRVRCSILVPPCIRYKAFDQDTVNKVLDEFLGYHQGADKLGLGAGNYIRNVMTRALGEDKAESVLSRITCPVPSVRSRFWTGWMPVR